MISYSILSMAGLGGLLAARAGVATRPLEATNEAVARQSIEAHYAFAADPKTVPQSSALYADDAVLEFPQGGERIRGKANIIAFRTAYPARVDFTVRRTLGQGGLWVNEGILHYDGERPTHFVAIMEFRGDQVVRETIYFGEPWSPPAWRAQWVEPIQ